jgi:glycosyltransferase involved in cell wall biosynthesis
MKVIQVVSSNLPIEDTGKRRWGALELIQKEYQKMLHLHEVDCEIRWLNEIQHTDDTIVHIHVANLCLEAQKMGIPYIYSNHDHTAAHFGKGSWLYNQQLEAIKGSVFSIAHGESVIDFFSETDKLFYLPHGVDTEFYLPSPVSIREKRLLMVASNGMAGDYGIDRKGFRLGIEAAKRLGMPITVVGSEANAKFFEIHKDLTEYDLLTIDASNPTELQKLKYFQSHYLFLHPSSLEFGSPNLSLLESWACELPMVAAYDGRTPIEGLVMLERLDVDDVVAKIQYAMDNYDSLIQNMKRSIKRDRDWFAITRQLVRMYDAYMAVKNIDNTDTVKYKLNKLYGRY